MIYAVIAAGGKGERMNTPEAPKQLLELCGKPVLIHTLEKFINIPAFEKILVPCPEDYVIRTREIIGRFLKSNKIEVICAGETRSDTLIRSIDFIENEYGIDEKTVIVTHDAVRPFVTEEIIRKHIEKAEISPAVGTAIPAVDTVFVSTDGNQVDEIPDRSSLFLAQTPQTFNAILFRRLFNELSEREKSRLTDGCGIFTLKGFRVTLVEGERNNIKITHPIDMLIAKAILSE